MALFSYDRYFGELGSVALCDAVGTSLGKREHGVASPDGIAGSGKKKWKNSKASCIYNSVEPVQLSNAVFSNELDESRSMSVVHSESVREEMSLQQDFKQKTTDVAANSVELETHIFDNQLTILKEKKKSRRKLLKKSKIDKNININNNMLNTEESYKTQLTEEACPKVCTERKLELDEIPHKPSDVCQVESELSRVKLRRQKKKPSQPVEKLYFRPFKNIIFFKEGFETTTKMNDLGLSDKIILQNLVRNSFTCLFKVQSHVLPWIFSTLNKVGLRQDVFVQGPPGSGKTLCYILPILQSLKDRFCPRIRAVIVVPVIELGVQVYTLIQKLCVGTQMKAALIGNDSIEKERNLLVHKLPNGLFESVIDVLITTPGHLLDHLMNTEGFSISGTEFLVIDEADKVICCKNDWLFTVIKFITNKVPQNPVSLKLSEIAGIRPQILMFSATLLENEDFLNQFNLLYQPKGFCCVPWNEYPVEKNMFLQEGVINKFVRCLPAEKPLAVATFLLMGWTRILCFMKTNTEAHRLAKLLQLLHKEKCIRELTVNTKLSLRDKCIKDFAEGCIDLLITTNRIARGLDIVNTDYVILYNLPIHCETYIHRAGRTARAGRKGYAVTLLMPGQFRVYKELLQSIGSYNIEEIKMDKPLSNEIDNSDKWRDYRLSLMTVRKIFKEEEMQSLNKLKRDKRTKEALKKLKNKNK